MFDSYADGLDQALLWGYDLAGNRTLQRRDDRRDNRFDPAAFAADEAAAYDHDANDRLTEERRDGGADGSVERVTAYGYGEQNRGTRQTARVPCPHAAALGTEHGIDLPVG